MGRPGLEQSGMAGAGGAISGEGGAKCGAHPDALAAIAADARLARVVEEWGRLPAKTRELVLSIVTM